MKSETSNIREFSVAEIYAAELIASGLPKDNVHSWLETMNPVYRIAVIDELVQDYQLEMMSKMNLYRIICNLEAIRTEAMSAGSYDAAALAAARLADLLSSIPKP